MNKLTKLICTAALFVVLSNTACDAKTETPIPSETGYTDIKLGEDGKDLKENITILTNRSDLIQDTEADYELPDYVKEFNKLYPDITVTFESVTDYDFDVANRLSSGNWGDICYIPNGVELSELNKYFEPMGSIDDFGNKYLSIESKAYTGTVYGIPSACNIQGIVYNKKIWADAGITNLPATPAEFIDDLKLIKKNTDAIPLYTNYNAEWPLTTWDYHIFGSACDDVNYRNDVMTTQQNPFSEQDNATGAFEVYNMLYQIVSNGLIEENPADTSWELCKGQMNNGKIGCMILGSWAVSQIQAAGPNADDIGYMPFPITINGKQHALIGSDYCYGINNNISDEKKLASKLYIKFMSEKSGYAGNNSCIPVTENETYPDIFTNFENVELLSDIPTSDMFNKINSASGIDLGNDPSHIIEIIDAAINKTPFDKITDDWNEKWTAAQNNED